MELCDGGELFERIVEAGTLWHIGPPGQEIGGFQYKLGSCWQALENYRENHREITGNYKDNVVFLSFVDIYWLIIN